MKGERSSGVRVREEENEERQERSEGGSSE